MADETDEATIIAWIDGELNERDSARVAADVDSSATLAAMAERHRRMRTRFEAAFKPIAEKSVGMFATAPPMSMASIRVERENSALRRPGSWPAWSGAIAASLMIGVLLGHQFGGSRGVEDSKNALALSGPFLNALDHQLSGEAKAIRVTLSFRDHSDHMCRSFSGTNVSGVACREGGDWQLRYATPTTGASRTDYRMAGTDAAKANIIEAIIAGEPLDREAEKKARQGGWN